MVNNLLLQSKGDIPFVEAKLTIHQPTLYEIAPLGEDAFWTGCELLNFSKELLSEEDKSSLTQQTNFDVLLSILKDKKNMSLQRTRVCILMVLALIFPEHSISLEKESIVLKKQKEENVIEQGEINNKNYDKFKEIVISMFHLTPHEDDDYNPQSELAKKLAEKMKAGRKKAAESKKQKKSVEVITRYISILSVGLHKSKNELMQYTVPQLFDEFERFQLKTEFDMYVRAKLAGAKDLKEVDNWMKELN